MSDIINRADAIDAVCGNCEGENYPKCDQTQYCEEVKALLSLPSAEAPYMFSEAYVEQLRFERDYLQDVVNGQWIPCSERLPNVEDCPMDCMVTRKSKFIGNYVDMAVAEADGTWTHEDWKAITIKGEATCISTRDADIVAWMPLPKPYREDGEDE